MKNTATGGKLLILYGEFGAGHRQAAKALVEANHVFRTFDEAVEINIMEILHPRLHSLESRLYVKSIQKFPDLYDYLFHKTRWNSRLNSTLEHLKWFSERRLLELLKQEQPSAVVSTFPLASAAVAGLKSDGLTDVPLVTVITDYTCHSLWVHPQTDLYAVAAEPVRKALIKSGVPEHRVIVSGIPVAPRFSVSKDKTALRRKHRLHPSDPVVLVMGGGCGLMQRDLLKGLNRPGIRRHPVGTHVRQQPQTGEKFRGSRRRHP